MGEMLEPLIQNFKTSLRVEGRAGRLTGDPGEVLLREVLERSGIVSWMTARRLNLAESLPQTAH
jgi:hypothetical protein